MGKDNFYDMITGLPNMSYFLQLAEVGKQTMLKNGELPVLLYFDLKGMKFFNSKYGLKEGDILLNAMAQTLKRFFPEENCGRMGQDHFAVFTKEEGVEDVLNEFFEVFKHANEGRTLPVHVGIYSISFEDVSISTACDRAKIASDKDKSRYSSTFTYYDEQLHNHSNRYSYVLNNFDTAIKEKWIRPYYQPLVRSVNGKVCDEEALARWIDPEEGMIPPNEFIYVLEDARLIHLLDLHILDMVIEDMKLTQKMGLPILPVSINLSKYDFQLCDIVDEINKRVTAAGISPKYITLEVTESVSTFEKDFVREQIEKVHAAGFKIWMDDFGSGYSSLNMLQSFDFDAIKFDMIFLKDFAESKKNHIILKELIQMAMKLDIDSVVEGVETIDQARFLREIGANKMQGYYWGKPNTLENKHLICKTSIGNPTEKFAEIEYYDSISKANLLEPDIEADYYIDPDEYFGPHPMGVIEVKDNTLRVLRYNKSYAMFLLNAKFINEEDLGTGDLLVRRTPEASFMETLDRCIKSGKWESLQGTIAENFKSDLFLKYISKNEVTNAVAVEIVIVSITTV